MLEVARQAASTTWGGFDRNEAYWRWLVGRKSHDALIVAIDTPDDAVKWFTANVSMVKAPTPGADCYPMH